MPRCVIISSMPLSRAMRLYVPSDAFVIAADAGYRQAEAIGVVPDLILGDFDSAEPPDREHLVLPREKDDTDTFFAVQEAVRRGFTDVTILGGTGGRQDHTLANFAALLYLAKNGVENLMADEDSEVRCIGPGTLRMSGRSNCYLSIFAAANVVRGVTLRGVKYPLQNADLRMEVPIGISNEFVGPEATITLEYGYLFVMITDKDKP